MNKAIVMIGTQFDRMFVNELFDEDLDEPANRRLDKPSLDRMRRLFEKAGHTGQAYPIEGLTVSIKRNNHLDDATGITASIALSLDLDIVEDTSGFHIAYKDDDMRTAIRLLSDHVVVNHRQPIGTITVPENPAIRPLVIVATPLPEDARTSTKLSLVAI